MADLRIADAPEIALENITGNEKVPTGGYGNSAVTITNIGEFARTTLSLATESYVSNAVGQKENKITLTGLNLTPTSTLVEIPQTSNSVLNTIHQDLLNRMEWIKDNVAAIKDHQSLENRDTFNTHPSSSISHNGTSNVSIEIEDLKNDVLTINTTTIPELENAIVGKQDVIVNDVNLIATSELSNVPSTNNSALNNSLQALINRDKFIDDNIKTGLPYEFDQDFSDEIGGYPLGAELVLNDGLTKVVSEIPNNTTNPNSDLTGWIKNNSSSRIIANQFQTQEEINNLSVSVLSYGAKSNNSPSENFDSTEAFKKATDFEWVVFPAPASMSYYPKSKSKRIRVPLGRYLITDTIPIVSYVHWDFDDGVVLEFKPNSPKAMFYPAVDKAKAAYQAGNKNWKCMSVYGFRMTGSATLLGNMTATSTNHATTCLHLGNPCQANIERILIEGFKTGIHLTRLTQEEIGTPSTIGNFYNNVLNNVTVKDCTTCLINDTNLLTVINGSFGIEKFNNTSPNMGDYAIINRGAGTAFVGTNIASLGYVNNPKKALIYDKCDGSTYQSIYSEKFNTLIEVDPYYRFGGLKLDTSHIYKTPSDILLKFVDGFMPYYDPVTKTRKGVNIKGPSQFVELPQLGITVGNSNAELLTDYFKFAPQFDFKYGLYGTTFPWTQQIAVDFKRYESVSSGFLSKNGARFIATQASTLIVPISNTQYDCFVCVLAKVIAGSFNAGRLKLNATLGSDIGNTYITAADVMYDYGNGWKMYAIRDAKLEPRVESSLQIEFSVGDQVEIEHIGAYKGGVPLYPHFASFVPKVNHTNFMFNQTSTVDTGLCSGGSFKVGDLLDPFVPVVSGVVNTKYPIDHQYVLKEGSNRSASVDGNHVAYYGNADINFSDTTTFDSAVTASGNSRNFAESIGIGQYIGITQGGTTTADAKVIDRVYDVATGKYTTKIVLNKSFNVGTAVASHATAQKPVFTTVKGVDVARTLTGSKTFAPPSLAANEIKSTTVNVDGAVVGNSVDVGFSQPLGSSSRMWGEVSSLGVVTVYHQNLTTSTVTVASGNLTVKVTQ